MILDLTIAQLLLSNVLSRILRRRKFSPALATASQLLPATVLVATSRGITMPHFAKVFKDTSKRASASLAKLAPWF